MDPGYSSSIFCDDLAEYILENVCPGGDMTSLGYDINGTQFHLIARDFPDLSVARVDPVSGIDSFSNSHVESTMTIRFSPGILNLASLTSIQGHCMSDDQPNRQRSEGP
jgi:hypothetical protein